MHPIRLSLFAILLTALVGLSLLPGGAASASAYILHPQSILNGVCCSSGSVSAMWVLDQSGTQDAPSKYVAFTTPGQLYSGFRRYYLPASIVRSTVSALRVKMNY